MPTSAESRRTVAPKPAAKPAPKPSASVATKPAASASIRPDRVDALLDTSAAVALLVSDHQAHGRTMEATRDMRLGLAGHAWFETYSVLTRLPAGLRRRPEQVLELLRHDFHGAWFMDASATVALTDELSRLRITGGAVYDALVGAAARHHDQVLLTGDRRALRTYDALGVRVRLVA